MNADLNIGSLTAPAGSRTYGVQELTLDKDQTHVPIFLINGKQEGPTLAVTGGIHGAEYASIEAALRLGRSLQPETLHGRVIVVPIVSMPAYKARAIYIVPFDGKNLNRQFPGSAQGTASEQLAHWLTEKVLKQADYYIDLHGGDMNEALVPFTLFQKSGDEKTNAKSLELARVFGIKYLVGSEVKGSTVSAAAALGVPGILPESGGQGIWEPHHIQAHSNGLDRVMRHLKMIPGAEPEPVETFVMDQFAWLRSDHDGCYYPSVRVGDTVQAGQAVGRVAGFDGKTLQEITAPLGGAILFLVSSLAINAGDPLLAIGA